MNDKTKTILFWISTALVALAMLAGGLADLIKPADLVADMGRLGYPVYFMTILGVWKVLGAVAILAPKFPRIKEWAYAGIFFDLSGAFASHLSIGDPITQVIPIVVLIGMLSASYTLRPESRRLA